MTEYWQEGEQHENEVREAVERALEGMVGEGGSGEESSDEEEYTSTSRPNTPRYTMREPRTTSRANTPRHTRREPRTISRANTPRHLEHEERRNQGKGALQ